jgi:hypothetical protein
MVFNATFNNISVISWRSALLVEETGEPGENHWHVASHWQTLSHNVVHLALIEIQLTISVVIGTDCIGSCISNYHTIMAMMDLKLMEVTCYFHERSICLDIFQSSVALFIWTSWGQLYHFYMNQLRSALSLLYEPAEVSSITFIWTRWGQLYDFYMNQLRSALSFLYEPAEVSSITFIWTSWGQLYHFYMNQ